MKKYNDDSIQYYTTGACHEFAIALHRLKGYSFVVVESYNTYNNDEDYNDEKSDLNDIKEVIHVYAYDKKNDTLHDIFGTISFDKINKDIEEKFNENIYNINFLNTEKELKELYVEDNKHDRQLYEYKEKDIQEAIDLIRNHEKENNKKNSGPEIKM